jgi:PAS domain S-box-containing protein
MAENRKQLRKRLDRAEAVVDALRDGEADAIVGKDGVALLRLREVERALRESEERLRLASDAARLGVFEWDVTVDAPRWINERMFEIFGRTRDQGPLSRAEFVAEVLHPDDVEPFHQAIAEAQQGDRLFRFTCRICRSGDGEQRWIEYSGRFDCALDGTPQRLTGVIWDITDRKQAEVALRDLNETLEQRVEERTAELETTVARLRDEAARRELAERQLLDRSAHLEELNRELQRRAEQLRDLAVQLSTAEDRERRRLAEVLHDDLQQTLVGVRFQLDMIDRRLGENGEARAALDQVRALVDQAVGQSQSLSHELSPPALHQGLDAGLEWLADRMEAQHGLAVDLDVDAAGEAIAEPLKTFLYKAVRELLFNVVKHAGVRRATVEVTGGTGGLTVAVRDEGHGFDPASLDADDRRPGFGLMRIQERVELLGGRLRIQAEPGEGSTFKISLPDEPPRRPGLTTNGKESDVQSAQGKGNRQAAGEVAPGEAPAVRRTVLLVDDHQVMREGLSLMLEYEPDLDVAGVADNGKQAVDLAGRLRPDVIVMDVSMPVMNGVEATRIIKREFPGIRIVGLTMYEQKRLAREMLEAGADVHLIKTGRSDELLAAIRGEDVEA